MNRRQRVALVLSLVFLGLTLAFPYSSYMPASVTGLDLATASEEDQIKALCAEFDISPKDGFLPIWLMSDPFGIDRPIVANSGGIYWSVVGWTLLGITLSTALAVVLFGHREWRRSAVARIRRAFVRPKVRLRFSVRGLMVAVVLTALAVQAAQFPRWLEYHRKAVYYRSAGVIRWPASSNAIENQAQSKRISEWADAMKQKYEQAQFRPWQTVEPDPPCPW